MQKETPKSCSCSACKRGKGTRSGKQLMRLDERAHRHAANLAARTEKEVPVAPKGNYYD